MSRTRSPQAGRNEGREVAEPRPGWDMLPPKSGGSQLARREGHERSRGGRSVAPIKVPGVLPDPVHDDGQLAGNCHFGPAHADPAGQAQPPCLELTRPRVTAEQDICRLEQVGPQQTVAAF